MKGVITLSLFLLLGGLLFSQDDPLADLWEDFDEDSLFGVSEEESVEIVDSSEQEIEIVIQDGPSFEWGGKVYSEMDAIYSWDSSFWELNSTSPESSWDPRFGMDLFFDARPDDHYRVFTKAKVFYPFEDDKKGDILLYELFADFNWQNQVFFRMGKQTINWNVGYLYSPADILNLSPIDPNDPEADREGPLALKTQYPTTAVNWTLFTIAQEAEQPDDISWATKADWLWGNWEVGVGGFYNPQLSPKGALFLSGPLGQVDFFSEVLLQHGSDKNFFITNSPLTEERDQWMFAATLGGRVYKEKKRLNLVAQYWFDQEAQSFKDLDREGHHFVGFYGSKGFLLNPQAQRSQILRISLLGLGNLSDGSGLLTPQVEWEPIDHGALALGANLRYGSEQSYYRYRGITMEPLKETEIFLSFRLGYGNF